MQRLGMPRKVYAGFLPCQNGGVPLGAPRVGALWYRGSRVQVPSVAPLLDVHHPGTTRHMTTPWGYPDFDAHEAVHFVTDRASGLRAIIAMHSTHLGPAAGGTRL